jgi:hypothetical protein
MSPKGLGPEKDYAGEDQQHVQQANPSFRREGAQQEQVYKGLNRSSTMNNAKYV